jgi:hypothetical protein
VLFQANADDLPSIQAIVQTRELDANKGVSESPAYTAWRFGADLRAAKVSREDAQWLAKFVRESALSPIVRLALASACQRLTVEQRKPIVLALLAHEEDKDDPNLPLMDWYAAEPIVAADPAWAAEALAACKIPKVSEFIARRMSEK